MSAGRKGRGLFALENIKSGNLITEYIGQVIDEDRCRERLKKQHFYAIYLCSKRVRANGESKQKRFYIDSSIRGNEARFINHSCDPNAEARYVFVGHEKRIGIYAIKDILVGDEITFDYLFEDWGSEPTACYCGSECCTGFMDKNLVVE